MNYKSEKKELNFIFLRDNIEPFRPLVHSTKTPLCSLNLESVKLQTPQPYTIVHLSLDFESRPDIKNKLDNVT